MIDTASHPGDDAWLDLARQVSSPERAAELGRHLSEGCDLCRAVYGMWKSAVAVAAHEQANDPPAESVRAVKSAFSLRRRISLLDRAAMVANLLYDSLREPLPVGFRGNSASARLLLHEAGEFSVDLRVEKDTGEGPRWVTGQVVKKGERPDYTSASGVLIQDSTGQVLAQTFADRAGEFQVQVPSEQDVTAYLELPDGTLIRVCIPVSDA